MSPARSHQGVSRALVRSATIVEAKRPVTDDSINLDQHRGPAGKMASEMRRHGRKGFEEDQEALRLRQEELETQLLAQPSETWPEAAAKAQYLIRRYAATAEAQDARRKKLIERALEDLARLTERETQE